VTIEVWDENVEGKEELEVAYEGELLLTGDSVDIGNVEANDLHRIRLGNAGASGFELRSSVAG
jgi:hypothetical protein